jgi:hypothetical protein
MREGWKTWALYAVLVIGVCSLLVGTCVYEGLKSLDWNPPPNAEAKRRERIIDALQPALQGDSLRLLLHGSSPGKRAGDGDFQLGDEVRSYRDYAFTGERAAACAIAVDRFLASGWTIPSYASRCDADKPEDKLLYVGLDFDCGQFKVTARVFARVDLTAEVPRRLEVQLEANYPTNVTGTLPDAGLAPACR